MLYVCDRHTTYRKGQIPLCYLVPLFAARLPRDAARRAGSSVTADACLLLIVHNCKIYRPGDRAFFSGGLFCFYY